MTHLAAAPHPRLLPALALVALVLPLIAGSTRAQDDPRLSELPKFLDGENVERLLSDHPDLMNVTTTGERVIGGDLEQSVLDIKTNIENFIRTACPANPDIVILTRDVPDGEPSTFAYATVRDLAGIRKDFCNPDQYDIIEISEEDYNRRQKSATTYFARSIELEQYFGERVTDNKRFRLDIKINDEIELGSITLLKLKRNRTFIGRFITRMNGNTDPVWAPDIIFTYNFPIGRGYWVDDL